MSCNDTRNTLLQEVHVESDRVFLSEHKALLKCDPLAKIIQTREDNMPKHGKVVNRGFVALVSDLEPVRDRGPKVRGKSRKSLLGQDNPTQVKALQNIENTRKSSNTSRKIEVTKGSVIRELKAFLEV